MNRNFRTGTSLAALVGAAAFMPGAAFAAADEGTENAPIVVTAQRRAEASVDVPITVASLGAEALETAKIENLSDIAKLTPGLRFDFAGAYFQPTIRGVGTAVTTAGGGGNVGIYVDGFYSPNPLAAAFNLTKVESIQVLKGPQGTLFGRNTTGGAILVQTADPSTDTSGEVKFSYGRFNEVKAQAYATYGISDRVAIDVEGQYRRGDGWLTNISNNDKKVGEYENWTVRLGLKAELSDNVSVLIRYMHSRTDDPTPLLTASYRDTGPVKGQTYNGMPFIIASGAPWFAQPGQFTYNPREIASGTHPSDQEYFHSNADTLQLTIKADLGFADLTSYSQYRAEKVDASIELDYSGVELFQLGLPNDNETWSQELLMTSKPGGKLQWTAGLFYFQNRDTYLVYFDYFPVLGITSRCCFFGSSATVKSAAAFLDATYEVTPQLFLTAGARYAHDWITDDYSIPAFGVRTDATQANYAAVKHDRVTPRFVIRYKPTEESSVYASYTKGYKAGIIDNGGGIPTPVKPETIDAFEVGFKYDNRRLSADLSGFYYDYKNLQVSLYQNARAVVVNAATSRIYGLDGSLRYRFDDHFEVNLGATWLHARYRHFDNAPIYTPCSLLPPVDPGNCPGIYGIPAPFINTFPIVAQTLTNVTMQRAPEFTGNIGARYKTDVGGGELVLSGNLFYTSKFFFGPSGVQFPQKGYEVVAVRAQWTDPSDTYTIALWSDNLTNSRYRTQVQYGNYGIGANWSKPVTFGVEVGAKFR